MTDSKVKPSSGHGLRRLSRNVWVLTGVSFLTDISTDMVVNVLPLFLANVLGARTAAIGLIEGLAESVASLLKIVSGWLSDRMGTRKWLTVLGYGISTAAKPFLLVASVWPQVLGVRLAERFGKGVRTAPRDALIADSIDPANRGLAFGVQRAGDTAGALVGILIALFVVWLTQRAAQLLTRETFQLLVLISLVPAVLSVLLLIVGVRETPVTEKRPAPRLTLRGFDAAFRRFVFVIVLFTLGNSADAFLILRGQERGLSVLGVLGMLATFNLIYALVSGPAGALSDRLGRRRLLLVGWTLYALVYLGFAAASAAWQIWLLYALYGVYYGAVEGTAKAFVADTVRADARGTAYGVYNAAVGIAALPASLIAGILWQGLGGWMGFGPRAPFLFGALLALLAMLLLRFWVPDPAGGP